MTNEDKPRPPVLLIEDDTALAEMVMTSLGEEFDFERAGNAAEAQLLLATRSFEILLADHMLPDGQQGLELLIEAMERFPKSRRILLTGYMNPEMLTRSVAVAGLSACLMKPIKMTELKRVLHATLGMDA